MAFTILDLIYLVSVHGHATVYGLLALCSVVFGVTLFVNASDSTAVSDSGAGGASSAEIGPVTPQAAVPVQQAFSRASSGTTAIVSLVNTAKPGNTLVLVIGSNPNTSTGSSVSGGGCTWSKVVGSAVNRVAEIWVGVNSSGVGVDITVTLTGATSNLALMLSEWAGLLTASPTDVSGATNGVGANTTASITTTNGFDLVIAGLRTAAVNNTSRPNGNFTPGSCPLGWAVAWAYQTPNAIGTFSCTWGTYTGAYDAVIAAFKFGVATADSTAVTDSVSANVVDLLSVSDSTAVTDTSIAAVSNPNVSVTDSTAVSDVPTLEIFSNAKVSDSTAVTDVVTVRIQSYISVADSTAVSDVPALEMFSNVKVSDSTAVSDVPAISIPSTSSLSVSVSDSTAVFDSGGQNTARGTSSVSSANYLQQATGIELLSANSGPFTIAFWFQSNDVNQANAYLLQGGGGNQWAVIYGFTSQSVEFFATAYAGTDPRQGTATSLVIADTNWHHVAYRKSASGPSAWDKFLDGVKTSINASIDFTLPDLSTGGLDQFIVFNANNFAAPVNGGIGDLAVYTSALTDLQIQNLAGGQHPTGAPAAYFPLLGNQSPELDAAGNGYSLTVNGSVPLVAGPTYLGRGPQLEIFSNAIVSDSTAVSDVVTVAISSGGIIVHDSTVVTDAVSVSVADPFIVSDSTAVSDAVKVQILYNVKVSDSTAVTDVPAFEGFSNIAIGRQAASDNFTRADGGLGASWTAIDSPLQIVGNVVESNPSLAAGHSLYTAIGWGASQYSSATILACDVASSFGGVVVRGDFASENCYLCVVSGPLGPTATVSIYRFTPQTLLANIQVAVNVGDVITGVAVGSSITAFINGIQVLAVSDSTLPVGMPGVFIQPTSSQAGVQLDNWIGGVPGEITQVSDVVTLEMFSYLHLSDSTAVSDVAKVETLDNVGVADSTAVTDSVVVAVSTPLVQVVDSTAVTDVPVVEILDSFKVSDSTAVSDVILANVVDVFKVSDSTAVSDVVTVQIKSYISVSDSTVVSDVFFSALFGAIQVSDSTAVTDSVKVAIPISISVADSTAVSDHITPESFLNVVIAGGLVTVSRPSVYGTLTFGTAEYGGAELLSSSTDTIGGDITAVTDVVIVEIISNVKVSDSTAVSDSVGLNFGGVVVAHDATVVTDVVSLNIGVNLAVADSTAVSDSAVQLVSPNVSVSDSTAVSDNVSVEEFYNLSVSDSTAVSDSASIGIQANEALVVDSTAVSDVPTIEIFSNVSVSDATVVSDLPSVLIAVSFRVADSTAVSDTDKIETLDNVSVSDSTAVSDVVTLREITNVVVSDSTAVSDVVQVSESTPGISAADSTAVSDVVVLEIFSSIKVSDATTVSDHVSINALVEINVFDVSAVSDAPVIAEISYISVSDSTGVSDRPNLDIAVNLSVADTTSVTDHVFVTGAQAFVTHDSTAVSDHVVLVIAVDIFVSDTTAVSDSVLFGGNVFLSVSDQVGANDVVTNIIVIAAAFRYRKLDKLICYNRKMELEH